MKVVNPNGDEFVLNPISDWSITWNFDMASASIDIPADASGLPVVTDLVSDIVFSRGPIKMFTMRVLDSEDVLTRESHSIRLTCATYEKILRDGRIMYTDMEVSNADQHVLAWYFVTTTQARQTLGITLYPNPASGVSRSTTVRAGTSVAEAIDGIAANGDGFDWWIDQDLQFHAQTPRRESLVDEEWTWGAEIAELTRSSPAEQYLSAVHLTGSTSTVTIPGGATYPPPAPAVREITPMPYGRWEKAFSYSDVLTAASLIKRADWHLGTGAELRPSYRVVLEQGIWTPAVQLGGIVSVRAQANSRLSFKVAARIEEITIAVSGDNSEAVSMMLRAESEEINLDTSVPPATNPATNTPPAGSTVISPPAPTGLSKTVERISPIDNLANVIASLAARISRRERNP